MVFDNKGKVIWDEELWNWIRRRKKNMFKFKGEIVSREGEDEGVGEIGIGVWFLVIGGVEFRVMVADFEWWRRKN